MAVPRFDTIARLFAQTATPVAPGSTTSWLFVQSYQSGHIAKTSADRATITLERGSGQTIAFSDRPERIVRATPTPAFLAGLGFSAANPPNAALLVDDGSDHGAISVVELTNPTYDPATHTATYDLSIIADDTAIDIRIDGALADLSALGSSFGATHLFIDDCPDAYLECHVINGGFVGFAGTGGLCWNWGDAVCEWCNQDGENGTCNETIPECNNNCWAYERADK